MVHNDPAPHLCGGVKPSRNKASHLNFLNLNKPSPLIFPMWACSPYSLQCETFQEKASKQEIFNLNKPLPLLVILPLWVSLVEMARTDPAPHLCDSVKPQAGSSLCFHNSAFCVSTCVLQWFCFSEKYLRSLKWIWNT